MIKNKLLFKTSIASSMLVLGLFINHSIVMAEELESQADIILSEGIRLTAVPSFEFGKILYDGQETSAILEGKNIGDNTLSWFDGTPDEGVRVYATIKDLQQPGMAEASLSFKTEGRNSVPEVSTSNVSMSWFQDAQGQMSFNGNYELKFNGEKTLLVMSSNKGQSDRNYKFHKRKGVKDFKMSEISKKKIDLPAGLTPASMEMTIDWDIESAP